ncbi:MAG: DUF2399 domain-containing protein [Kiritimatiellae bacterium]|nr:DUF2399 domain-containing protein [Kiritimatiellia bacterium]
MTSSFWQERLDRCPAMKPWLLRVAKRAVTGMPLLPAVLTLGDVPADKAVRRALEEVFPGCREENGRLKARLDGATRECARWLPLAELLGVRPRPPPPEDTPGTHFARALRRLKLLYPDAHALIDAMRGSESLMRFFKTSPSAPDGLIALCDALVSLRTAPAGVTLSELGAKFFNDSKALRQGLLRQQLEHLLRLQTGNMDDDTVALLNTCGIIENPYTTHAVVFAPFAYRSAEDGAWLDWPYRLWQRGEAAILSWRTVRTITRIRAEEPFGTLVLSENAAPFHRLVETRRTALYTEGYPNAAVKTLLRLFAQTGVTGLHWGDTDLDGYRIAEQVAREIPIRLYVTPATLDRLRGRLLPLTGEQHRRLSTFIDAHPDFPFLDALRHTLANGWLEQEQTIDELTGLY